jgi:uncharacterized protein (UPF0335 family)
MTKVTVPAATAKVILKSLVERIEQKQEERKSLSDEVRDLYAEARSQGFDVAALKVVIRERAKDPSERVEHDAIVQTYMAALGMLLTAVSRTATTDAERGSPSIIESSPTMAPRPRNYLIVADGFAV